MHTMSFIYAFVIIRAVPGVPGSVKATSVGKTSIRLNWAPPDNPNGRILEFQVIYSGYKLQETVRV